MKLLCSPTLSAVLFALATLPTPLVFAQAEPVNVTTAPPLRFTVAPGVESPIVMKTLPNAVCGLHQEPARDTEPSMKLYADADSTIRIHVKAKHASGESQLFAIDCAANGQIVRFPLELRAAPAPILDMPLPQASVAPPKGAYVRPALADEDAQQLSDEQLLKRDYPPRPDATKSPKVYAAWLKTVSKPATFIAAQTVSVPGISHKRRSKIQTDGADSYNWSGYQLQSSGRTYDLVLGIWYVPVLDSEIVFDEYKA